MDRPKIAIGAPIRSRAWILPEYLAALEAIDYSNKQYLFLENDSEDNTWDILISFACLTGARLYQIKTEVSHWRRGEYGCDQYMHLAAVRNKFIDLFLLTGADYLLSVDSDVIVPPDIIKRLLAVASQGPFIVGAAISNIPGQPLDGFTAGNFMVESGGQIIHPRQYPLTGVMDVVVVGAVYLIPRQALEDGVRYGAHSQGEDIYFSQQAREKGYDLKVVLDLQCDHRMTKGEE